MLALKKAISDVRNRIPTEILNIAFMTKIALIPGKVTTLDEQIKSIICRDIVLQDCNIVRGVSYTIPVDKCNQYNISYHNNQNHLIIEVPYSLTDNREILSALGLTYAPKQTGFSGNELVNLASMAMNNISSNVGGVTTSNVEIIGPNTVMVHENILGGIGGHLRITIENDPNFRNINNRAANAFSKLVLLATKGFIYNELVLELDKGYIYGGHDLSKIVEIVDRWENAWEEYDEYLKSKWAKISFMNDDEANSRFLKIQIAPGF